MGTHVPGMRHYRLRFGKSISVVLKLCCFETWRWFLVFFGAQTEYKVQKEYKCALILVSLGGGDFSSCKRLAWMRGLSSCEKVDEWKRHGRMEKMRPGWR